MMHGVVLGIDVGGSKTKGLRVQDGRVTGEALAGGANIASVGVDRAMGQIGLVLDRLGRDAAAVCIGAAGAETPQAQERWRRLIQRELPEARVRVVHDSRLILAASGLRQGIVLISGTGSVAWGIAPGGAEARAGGWGYLLGDEGSAYWVARAAVQHALAALDQEQPVDRLTARLVERCGLERPEELVDFFYAHPDRHFWADLAWVVFRLAAEGDTSSKRILDKAAEALAELVAVVARRLGLAGPVVMAGGLLQHQPLLESLVRARLTEQHSTDVRMLDQEPVTGAVILAEALLRPG